MSRTKLNMAPEERRIYDNAMHRKQAKTRRERGKRLVLIKLIWEVAEHFGEMGQAVRLSEKDVADIAEAILKTDNFKVVLGTKPGVGLNDKNNG